ncbi:uncharacterized protein LOC144030830 [Festucalex cinctus]
MSSHLDISINQEVSRQLSFDAAIDAFPARRSTVHHTGTEERKFRERRGDAKPRSDTGTRGEIDALRKYLQPQQAPAEAVVNNPSVSSSPKATESEATASQAPISSTLSDTKLDLLDPGKHMGNLQAPQRKAKLRSL